jgi:hypothetical protein
MEKTSTSSSTVVMSSIAVHGKQKIDVPADDFGERLRSTMSRRNEALRQPEITAKTEEAMAEYRNRIQDGIAAIPKAAVKGTDVKGSAAAPMKGHGGPIQVAKQLQAAEALKKEKAPPQVVDKKIPSPPSSDDDPPFIEPSRPRREKMVLKQGPIPKKSRREAELDELLADQERKKEADKVMLWRKLQAEIAKTSSFASEFDYDFRLTW